jgi:hypothetical protein
MREAIELILRHQEPYPAFVVSRHWEVLLANEAAMRMNGLEIATVPTDEVSRRLLEELLAYPGVPSHWRARDMAREPSPVLNLVFRSPDGELRFFETMTTFIGPRDVTLEELRIECSFPAASRCAKHGRTVPCSEG